ncbi:DUF4395 domain-containing protein [Paenibacillus kobensis]|uniref:DUF4395 domain-containing protein n=1 Tax=Paenibacillus kobensis TaxID=59841 RepID=UPI000FD8D0CF|nr:DUF4395 domain-containing protein [Paenibacillus kobensis]
MASHPLNTDLNCVDDVPLHRVRGNQLGILLFIIISVATQQLWLLLVPLAVQIISRTWGVRYNVFVRLFARIFPVSTRTESRELLRFNNLLAILFLLGAVIGFAAGSDVVGYIFVGFLSVAVILALSGFCLGCFMYFQWKQFLARRRISG